jgi:hypothetical protein
VQGSATSRRAGDSELVGDQLEDQPGPLAKLHHAAVEDDAELIGWVARTPLGTRRARPEANDESAVRGGVEDGKVVAARNRMYGARALALLLDSDLCPVELVE